jgi:CRISPR-associated protein Cas2
MKPSRRQPRPVSVPMHTWVVAYDIADDARRNRLAAVLEAHGERVQYSVFECRLDEGELQRLRDRVRALIVTDDSVRWYPLCRPCLTRTITLGTARAALDEGSYIV